MDNETEDACLGIGWAIGMLGLAALAASFIINPLLKPRLENKIVSGPVAKSQTVSTLEEGPKDPNSIYKKSENGYNEVREENYK